MFKGIAANLQSISQKHPFTPSNKTESIKVNYFVYRTIGLSENQISAKIKLFLFILLNQVFLPLNSDTFQ